LLYNREQLVMPFVKGDKRINRKGRPKSFDAARALAQSIAHEEVTNSKGDTVTVTEAILRQWAASKDPRLLNKILCIVIFYPLVCVGST